MSSNEGVVYLPISKPTKGVSGKTGTWRIFGPHVNDEKCIKCYICFSVCPENAIAIINEYPRVDYDYCKGCGICARECPVKAIEMRRER